MCDLHNDIMQKKKEINEKFKQIGSNAPSRKYQNACDALPLDRHQICNKLSQRLTIGTKEQQPYKLTKRHAITQYLDVNTENKDHLVTVQLIAALNDNVPIYLHPPHVIYYKGYIYKAVGKQQPTKRFQCFHACCGATIQLDPRDQTIYCEHTILHQDHQKTSNIKQQIIHDLIEYEIKTCVSMDTSTIQGLPRQHYERIKRKYLNKLPITDLRNFKPYEAMESNLHKYKPITNKLTSTGLSNYIQIKWKETLSQYCSSNTIRKKYEEQIITEFRSKSMLLTFMDSLRIFFTATAFGGDGTFNTRPQFLKVIEQLNSGIKITKATTRHKEHAQVFKIYAYHQYPTRSGRNIIKSYLVAIALLEDKKQATYEWMYKQLLHHVKQYYPMEDSKLKQYISDFEDSQRLAYEASKFQKEWGIE